MCLFSRFIPFCSHTFLLGFCLFGFSLHFFSPFLVLFMWCECQQIQNIVCTHRDLAHRPALHTLHTLVLTILSKAMAYLQATVQHNEEKKTIRWLFKIQNWEHLSGLDYILVLIFGHFLFVSHSRFAFNIYHTWFENGRTTKQHDVILFRWILFSFVFVFDRKKKSLSKREKVIEMK